MSKLGVFHILKLSSIEQGRQGPGTWEGLLGPWPATVEPQSAEAEDRAPIWLKHTAVFLLGTLNIRKSSYSSGNHSDGSLFFVH